MTSSPRRAPTGAAVLRPELTDAIVEAVIDELAEKGYGRTSMDGVARRADVGKSSLYRRWPSKQEMVVDAVSQLSVPLAEFPDSGSLRGDLQQALNALVDWLDDPRFGRILPDLVAEANRNKALSDALTVHLDAPRRSRGQEVLDRAIARGELPTNTDREVALDLLAAPIFWRLRVRRASVSPEYLEHLLESMLVLLGAEGSKPVKNRR